MAGGDPAPVPPDVHQHVHEDVQDAQQADPLLSSFRDRSVSEIETSFSEHFIPAVEEEEAEGVSLSSEYSGDFSSSELNTLPCNQPQPSAVTGVKFYDEGAIIDTVPYSNTNSESSSLVKTDPSAITDLDHTQSTKIIELSKIHFKKPWLPVFEKKSFESDSILGLTTESGSESLNCDSTIETEANFVADNIFQDNIENFTDDGGGGDTFLVSAKSDQVFTVKDFAFENQENFFDIKERLQIPLNLDRSDNQSLDIPLNQSFSSHSVSRSSKTFEDLSLIEEITEHSSISTVKSKDFTPRADENHDDNDLALSYEIQSTEAIETPQEVNETATESKLIDLLNKKSHKPKILQKTLSLDSPRVATVSSRIGKIGGELEQRLPSKSNPVTPREELREEGNAGSDKRPMYAQSKPKIVSKRFQRSPAKSLTPPSVPKPIQTKTGLTVTQPVRAPEESLARSASSASLILRTSGRPLRRDLSRSSDNVTSGTVARSKKYQHVGSKVKAYIQDIKTNGKAKNSSRQEAPQKERSLSSLSLIKSESEDKIVFENRPKTADATVMRSEEPEQEENLTVGKLRKSISKSESNLKRVKSGLSKSSISVGQLGSFCDSSDEDLTELTAIYNDEAASIKAESLLELVAKERKSKQEAKKVINELQTSFDDLLQKYAAAENALDKARFGIKPLEDGRVETFALADKVAEKIATFELEEKREEIKKLNKLKPRPKSSVGEAREKVIVISNQVSGLAMSVSCGLTDHEEALRSAMEAGQKLEDLVEEHEEERNPELAGLYLEARRKLEELKRQLRDQDKKDEGQIACGSNDLKLPAVEDERETPSFIASIRKVSDWQASIPTAPAPLSSCYGSLPASPTSPTNQSRDVSQFSSSNNITNKTLEADSGCPGSDRSTLWFSYLHSKRMSPSTRSHSKSKENIMTSLYNLEEENQPQTGRSDQDEQMVVTPRDILTLNNQFVQSITIENFETDQPKAKIFPFTSTPNGAEEYVTDLSDDEYEMLNAMKVNEEQSDPPQTPARSFKKLKACKSLFPGVESEALAQQIDNEILELRNFFDDHREEMLYLLHGKYEEGDRVNQSLPGYTLEARTVTKEPKYNSLVNITQQRVSTPELPHPENYHSHVSQSQSQEEDSARPAMFRSLQDWPDHQDSESDVLEPTLLIRKREFEKRRRRKERHRRKVCSSSERERSIHSYFPVVTSNCSAGHQVESDQVHHQIPRLNLSDLTSDITAPDMSLISEEFSLANGHNQHILDYEESSPVERRRRSIACDTLDLVEQQTKCPTSTQTTPAGRDLADRLLSSSETAAVNKSLPIIPDIDPALVGAQQKYIIINQKSCDHKEKSRKKKKKSKELRELLNSLDAAATMAEKLKKRSEDLLSVLANEK